ncbi:MAG: hypothetical protein RMJ75_02985 [Nitrososphaerota archaeon]|nr:hypothetical protein [Nitrososphaerota archaeon]
MRYLDEETGLPLEAAEKLKSRIRRLETKTEVIRVDEGGRIAIGSVDYFPVEIVTADLTVISRRDLKKNPQKLDESELAIALPEPKRYVINGKTVIGFLDDELPALVRTEGGYSLTALVALLIHKVNELETLIKQSGKET